MKILSLLAILVFLSSCAKEESKPPPPPSALPATTPTGSPNAPHPHVGFID